MKKYSATISLLIFLFLTILWPAFAQNTQDAPQLVIQKREFDFGKVKEGDRVTHDFVIMNKGNDILEIKKVSPG